MTRSRIARVRDCAPLVPGYNQVDRAPSIAGKFAAMIGGLLLSYVGVSEHTILHQHIYTSQGKRSRLAGLDCHWPATNHPLAARVLAEI
ncbi:hypothetical protein GCM10023188_31630 [Pontibacter saemangeumensis]|uniref:Uncharacterized protein n=1 Tax=Pontibacter saemangeumensis TaxID=1084525 RepID=A0ABP8LXI9_9BACT